MTTPFEAIESQAWIVGSLIWQGLLAPDWILIKKIPHEGDI
jgi:hypothetical protein